VKKEKEWKKIMDERDMRKRERRERESGREKE